METIPEKYIIEDTRKSTDFKTLTLSNYKKSEVKNALIESMLREKIENACNWSSELICSGHFFELWEVILLFFSKYIYLGNPKIPFYLKKRFKLFREITNSGLFFNEMDLRNDETIRKLFAEIICVLTISKKKNNIDYIKIDRDEEFDMTKNKDRFKAPTLDFANKVMKPQDPKELSIAINELLYNLSIKDYKFSYYWVDWIIEFDTICRSRKEQCVCYKRVDLSVEKKYIKDIIWLVWECIIYQSNDLSNFIKETVQALFDLFCIKYTNACCKKRRYIIYYAVSIMFEPIDLTINLIEDKDLIEFYKEKINEVYRDIKKNEIISEYNETEQNFNRSINKLKMLSEIDYCG